MNTAKLPVVMQALPRWDGKYASTSLNLAKELSKERRVFYCDHPFTYKDLFTGKTRQDIRFRKPIWAGKSSPVYQPFADFPNLSVVSPAPTLVINFLPKSVLYDLAENFVNRHIWKTLNRVLSAQGISKFIYINSFDPCFSRIYTPFEVALKVYHSVDNIAGERYIARHGVRREQEFAKIADLTISTSLALTEKLRALNPKSHFVPNAADYALFSRPCAGEPKAFEKIPKPRVLYMGNIGLRIDYDALEDLAKNHPEWQLVFVGPKDPREFRGQALEALPNVWFLGAKPYAELPDYAHAADVCLIPFIPNDLTKFIYPLKINEYLGTGKPVVTSRFADLTEFETTVQIYESPEMLYDAIMQAVKENSPEKEAARKKVASANTWEERGKRFDKILEDGLRERSQIEKSQLKKDAHGQKNSERKKI
ncbi:glycosyl transferase group 1 [Chloroherpeton thalassium ATCC 35110]|uniref:Glycosyl transferase group 1 n=1 Tax=Chloroherpeton thalassium (strain ATCC 35110 / GB-78) TaxID=517418 RepID=B3QU55_CHLT3|nr:glycosyltransferase [Chloroherpeton thalassium]ACF12853.1 glycosyl transferase group 1 [Chloroherpeton thalassium ATCC 35110]